MMPTRWITIVETKAFEADKKGRLAQLEFDALVDILAQNPEAGVVIRETGGLRKLRLAIKGKGKSGGARIIYYYCNETMPVFLLTLFAKNEKSDLSKAERNALAKLARELRESYGAE
jgi:hypothetical protein